MVLDNNVNSNFLKSVHKISYSNLSEFGMTCMKMCQKVFVGNLLCALQVFLLALVSRPVCARTCAQLRKNIAEESVWHIGSECRWEHLSNMTSKTKVTM